MARNPPQLTSAEPSETSHSTKLTNDIEAVLTDKFLDFGRLELALAV